MPEHIMKVRSVGETDFITAIAAGAKEDASLLMPQRMSNRGYITGVRIMSLDNLPWRVWFWKSKEYDHITDPDLDTLVDHVDFAASDGIHCGSGGDAVYRYSYTDFQKMHYHNTDMQATDSFKIHCSVQNTGAVAKTVGAAGELVLEIDYEPQL